MTAPKKHRKPKKAVPQGLGRAPGLAPEMLEEAIVAARAFASQFGGDVNIWAGEGRYKIVPTPTQVQNRSRHRVLVATVLDQKGLPVVRHAKRTNDPRKP